MADIVENNCNKVNHRGDQFTQLGTGRIVFIDPSVEDYQSLIAGVSSRAEVFVLDSIRDGVEQITEVLAGRSGVSSVHIASPCVSGSSQLSLDNTDNYIKKLQGWTGSLTDQADIVLYGCDMAAGDRDTAFVVSSNPYSGGNFVYFNNVSDIEGLSGATLSTTNAVGGTFTFDSDAPTILPLNTGFVGAASFKYTITDAGQLVSNTANVTVDIGNIISTGNQSQTVTGNNGNNLVSNRQMNH